jgi:glutaredoxin/glutathione-dependent peroxiredoxin
MRINGGDRLPEATFKRLAAGGLKDVTTDELCAGKTVVLFAVPGAFTPTCSARHLPGYLAEADALKANGVDTIACVAVNDAFVLDAWAKANDVGDTILMLADGNGTFTKAIGLEYDATARGFGVRSKRYAMVVADGVVKELKVEETPGVVEVSGADAILASLLDAAAESPARVPAAAGAALGSPGGG